MIMYDTLPGYECECEAEKIIRREGRIVVSKVEIAQLKDAAG